MKTIEDYLLALQLSICQTISQLDGQANFAFDHWHKPQGGGGRSGNLENGAIFERAGVNFSHVFGTKLPPAATLAHPELVNRQFEAMGLSLVFHPWNPYIPTVHMNVRFFMATCTDQAPVWWFGGGFDLTPYYGFIEDCRDWHQMAFKSCQPFGEHLYDKFKKQCDQYFYLPHRQEARGIGGLFFDDFNELPFEQSFAFMQSIGNHLLPAYLPILQRRQSLTYNKRERDFQLYRRGRYVEFNLVHDRGTHFGLQFGGRTESILMSLPPAVTWRYHWQPEPDTEEAKLTDFYLQPRDWRNFL